MNVRQAKRVHFIGIGGINMSAVAKLLLASGVRVSGSDVAESEQTRVLAERGADIRIGHAADNVPADADLVVYTSAAPPSNPEREEARRRNVPELTNFEFLGAWFGDSRTLVVAGTHGKSTTTAMLGLILERARLDPTVIVGSKVPSFPDGNLRIGSSDLFVVEGDEYARHFLEFRPFGVVLNNIELDHTDVFADLDEMVAAFRELLSNIKDGGILVANGANRAVAELVARERAALERRGVRVVLHGGGTEGGWNLASVQRGKYREVTVEKPGTSYVYNLAVPGHFNAQNAAGASLMALELGTGYPDIAAALEAFTGIWRRFELISEHDGARCYSDYGHHPTAVAETLRTAKELFPSSRVMLCFQPHHRNRTKHLFLDFIPSFDAADVLVLCEIYDVAGRDADEDADVSSRDLADAVMRHDADRGVRRIVEYAPDPASAVERTLGMATSGDIAIFMGAGDIDNEARAKTRV